MKKIFITVIAVALVFILCSCDKAAIKTENNSETINESVSTPEDENDKDSAVTSNESVLTTEVKDEDLSYEIEYCRFADALYGADDEFESGYTKKDGHIYVVTSVVITNKSASTISIDKFSGYCFYDKRRYDMQLSLGSFTGGLSDDKVIPADSTSKLYMFALLSEEAQNNDNLEVIYSLNGQEVKANVDKKDTRTALEKKTQLKKGDNITIPYGNGNLQIEVIDCKCSKYISTSDTANGEKYKPMNSNLKYVDAILRITNNLSSIEGRDGISNFYCYNDNYSGDVQMETDNNTKLSYANVGCGETEIVHVFAAVNDSDDISNIPLRFNVCGNCYYFYAN